MSHVELVRYCPACNTIGDVDHSKHNDCCPDGRMAFRVPRAFAEQCAKTFKLAVESRLAYPAELNDDLRFILGTVCFVAAQYVSLYRAAGHDVAHKAEAEQAFYIDRLLRAYLTHGKGWERSINDELRDLSNKLRDKTIKNKGGQQ